MTKEEFIEWRRHHVTKEVFDNISAALSICTETLIDGSGVDNPHTFALRQAKLIGHIEGLKYLLNITWEDPEQDEEHERA